jgi:hypothetical protein
MSGPDGLTLRARCFGDGCAASSTNDCRLTIPPSDGRRYHNAQIDDFGRPGRPPRDLHAPLELTFSARFSRPPDQLHGTAGFGLWSYPWAAPYALPRAVWFFNGTPPHRMPIAVGVPGHGWQAQVIAAPRAATLAWLLSAPLTVALLNLPPFARRLYPRIQRSVGISAAALNGDADTHHYRITLQAGRAELAVDGQTVLAAPAPHAALSFVAWIDNQFAVFDPRGRLGWGLQRDDLPQGLTISDLQLQRYLR